MEFGFFSLVPILVMLVVAIIWKDTFTSLLAGIAVGLLMVAGGNPIDAFYGLLDALYIVLADSNTAWVLMLVALFGALIMLLQESGGLFGFSKTAEKFLKTRKSSMIGTWVLGIVIFIDDYLNALAVGAATREITDKNKVSREMLAFIVNSTGVTVCALVPISTWGGFMGGLMESSGMAEGMSPVSAIVHALPYTLYAWAAVIFVPLVCLKIIPLFGPMKKAEKRALETGQVFPPGSVEANKELESNEEKFKHIPCRVINFLLPILIVVVFTVITEDVLVAIFPAIIACFLLYIPQKIMSVKKFFSNITAGFVDIFPVIIIIILAYVIMEVNGQLGLIDYVIEVALGTLSPNLLPVIIFVGVGLLSFASGSFWGLAGIAFPIVAPLAIALNVNPFLCAGAVISAVAFGGHICIYSDTVNLAAASTKTTNADYFRTSAPLVLIPFVVAAIGFLILGFVMV